MSSEIRSTDPLSEIYLTFECCLFQNLISSLKNHIKKARLNHKYLNSKKSYCSFLGIFQTIKSKCTRKAFNKNFEHLISDKTQLHNFDKFFCAKEQVNI